MTNSSANIYNAIIYPTSLAHKGFLEFEHKIGNIAKKGDEFGKAYLDPAIKYVIQPLQHYKMVVTYPQAQEIIDSSANFAVCRLPNYREAITNILIQTTVNFFAGRAKSAFGDNPTASAIIRDLSKLPSIEANVDGNNTIGFTDTKYQLGSLYASRIKVACKATILTLYSGYKYNFLESAANQGKDEVFPLVARSANYICEIPSRYLHIADKRKQAFEKQNPEAPQKEFFEFLKDENKISWGFEAIGEAIVKTTTSDQMGELAKKSGYESYIKETACVIDNVIAAGLLGVNAIPFSSDDDVYSKAFKYGVATLQSAGVQAGFAALAFAATSIVDFIALISIETINTYGLGTPTRICQDTAGLAIRNGWSLVQETMDSFQNKTPLLGQDEL